jgi:hypothetical protein
MSLHLAATSNVAETLNDLDAALPDIAGAFDLDGVGRMFAHDWRMEVTGCALVGARYEPGVRCVTTYELRTVDSTGSQAQTFGVVDVTPAGRRLRRFDEDEALPGLATAIDPKAMGRRLAALCSAPVQNCTVTAVRYRPGERATLRYGLTSSTGHVIVYGKLFAGAAALAITLAELHQAAEVDTTTPAVPPPIAVLDDLGLVIQPPAEGDLLHTRAFASPRVGPERVVLFRRTGRALAALHDGDGPPAARRTLAADVAETRTYLPAVRRVDPGLADRLAAAAEAAQAACGQGHDTETAPSHGSMRTDHVHISATRVTLLDLDGYCWAPRARDIGNLLAYLRWKALRQPRYRMLVAESRRAFRAGYRRAGHAPADDMVRTAEAISLLKIAGRRFRSLSVREWPHVPELVDAALELLPGENG